MRVYCVLCLQNFQFQRIGSDSKLSDFNFAKQMTSIGTNSGDVWVQNERLARFTLICPPMDCRTLGNRILFRNIIILYLANEWPTTKERRPETARWSYNIFPRRTTLNMETEPNLLNSITRFEIKVVPCVSDLSKTKKYNKRSSGQGFADEWTLLTETRLKKLKNNNHIHMPYACDMLNAQLH